MTPRSLLVAIILATLACERSPAPAVERGDHPPNASAVAPTPTPTPAPASAEMPRETAKSGGDDAPAAPPTTAEATSSPARLLHPSRAEAGGVTCSATDPSALGPHTMRRSRTVGPGYEVSNVLVARVGARLLAAWPADEASIRLQPLTDDATPDGDAVLLAAEGAPALFSLLPHATEPVGLLQIHRRCHRDNGARCIDSWWIGADGAPVGAKLEEFLGHTNNNLDEYRALPVAEGILAAKTFDDTRQGYAELGCMVGHETGAPLPSHCPLVMPLARLDRYALGDAGAVTVTPLLDHKDRARREVFLPLADGELRGAFHLWLDRPGTWHATLRLAGRDPVALAGFDDPGVIDDFVAHLDADAGTLTILQHRSALLHRHRLDGAEIAPPLAVGPEGAAPFDDAIVAALIAQRREIRFERTLATGQAIGEPLLLATADRDIVRFDTMRALIWDRGRFVVLYAEPARKGWTLMTRTITCRP